jgi:hypothetical protein
MPRAFVSALAAISVLIGALPALATDTAGVVDPNTGRWTLRSDGGGTVAFEYGNPGDVPFMGDWDCDGIDTPGLYRPTNGFVYLRNANSTGVADLTFFFGNPGDVPLAGDFDGDGCDTLSIYRPSEARFYIMNRLGRDGGQLGAADYSFGYGNVGDVPFVGDWTGDGVDTPGLRRPSNGFVYLRNSNSAGVADTSFFYGDAHDLPFAGDWDGNGSDSIGLFRRANATIYLRNATSTGVADSSYRIGDANSRPVSGRFGLPASAPAPGTSPSPVVSSDPVPPELRLGGNVGASVDERAATVVLHVATNHGSASDANPGSETKPLKTVGEALVRATQLRKGGTGVRVVVHPGVYRESIEIGSTGTSNPPPLVVEASAPGAVITGSDVWQGWSRVSGSNVYEKAWPYRWGVSSSSVQEIVARREMVFVGGVALKQVLSSAELAPGTFHVSESEGRVRLYPQAGADPTTSLVEVAVREYPLRLHGARNVVVRGVTVRHGTAPFDNTAAGITHSNNLLLDGLVVEWNTWAGLSVCCSERVTVRNTVVRHNGGRGIGVFKLQTSLFEGTSTTHNNWRGVRGGYTGWSVAGVKAIALRNVVFKNHTSVDNQMRGFWLDTDIGDVWVDGLASCRNRGYGMFLEKIQGPVSVTNSLLCGNSEEGLITSNSQHISVWGSTMCRNTKAQVRVSGDSGGARFTDWLTGAELSVPLSKNLSIRESTIVGSTDLFQALIDRSVWDQVVKSLRSDGNTWHNPATTRAFRPSGSGSVDFAEWRRLTGQDGSSSFGAVTTPGC